MKELSVKEKAKRYDEAIERANELNYVSDKDSLQRKTVEHIFPELAKSEDERIRKWLIEMVEEVRKANPTNESHNGKCSDAIAWLEKQDKEDEEIILLKDKIESLESARIAMQEYHRSELEKFEKQGEQKHTDKDEPKFRIEAEKWYICISQYCNCIEGRCYQALSDGRIIDDFGTEYDMHSDADKYFKLWTIQDAKDGDVLACESGWTCIFKALDNHTNTFSSYCFMDKDKWFCETGSECHTLNKEFTKAYNGEIKPSAKEQRDILMKAMADAGYTFDFDKKELKKIEQNSIDNYCSEHCKGYQETGVCFADGECDAKRESEQKPKFKVGDSIKCKKGYLPWQKIEKIDEHVYKLRDYYTNTSSIIPINEQDDWELVKPKPASMMSGPIGFDGMPIGSKSCEQKPAWSEEDNIILSSIIADYERSNEEWFNAQKSLPHGRKITWLKSLRPRNRWKPSDEQMEALDSATENCAYSEYQDCLRELIGQLKKLKEE